MVPYVSSPLIHHGRVYFVKTGAVHYESERLGVAGEYYATPVAVGEHIIVCAQRGTVFVLKDGVKLEVISRNELGATLAVLANATRLNSADGS